MATLKTGSSGSNVRELQQQLKNAGYNVTVDGSYGPQTEAAVKQYQQTMGLNADGVAGSQTLGTMGIGGNTYQGGSGISGRYSAWGGQKTSSANNTQQTAAQAEEPVEPDMRTSPYGAEYDANRQAQTAADLQKAEGAVPTFQQSQGLQDALNALQERLNGGKPAQYQSPYSEQIAALYDKAVGQREPFTYDPNGDPLYQMYRDRYTQAARQAMNDTMANAAQLSGGYGNSYAAAAGQQAYDQQMTGLNDILPELYSQAYGRYRDEGNDILQRLALAREMDETEYARYQNDLADYYNMMSAQRALAGDMYDREWQDYAARLGQANTDRDYYNEKSQQEMARMQALMEGGYISGDQFRNWLGQMGWLPAEVRRAVETGVIGSGWTEGEREAFLTDYEDYYSDGIMDGKGNGGRSLSGGSYDAEHPVTSSGTGSGSKSTGAGTVSAGKTTTQPGEPTKEEIQAMLDALERLEQERRKNPVGDWYNNPTMV